MYVYDLCIFFIDYQYAYGKIILPLYPYQHKIFLLMKTIRYIAVNLHTGDVCAATNAVAICSFMNISKPTLTNINTGLSCVRYREFMLFNNVTINKGKQKGSFKL